jgi:hypothetical protein
MASSISSGFPRRIRHLALAVIAGIILTAVALTAVTPSSVAHSAPARLVLNAPNCAQEVENYRRECLRACETSLIKPQCARSCNDPNKLSPRLKECEQRKKPA